MLGVIPAIFLMLIPIVAILTSHQRKMAEIIHKNHGQSNDSDLLALREEVRALRDAVNRQAIALDTRLDRQLEPPPLQEHLEAR
ncbi:MAG: hypothetical protein KF733_09350 [Fimbriimonadaceae bacterium]|nr:MAG: hypothetical protein KF733_09350 [Fimbriimonadaceae bacterium]